MVFACFQTKPLAAPCICLTLIHRGGSLCCPATDYCSLQHFYFVILLLLYHTVCFYYLMLLLGTYALIIVLFLQFVKFFFEKPCVIQSTPFSPEKQSRSCGYAPSGCRALPALPHTAFGLSAQELPALFPPDSALSLG